MLVLLSCMSVWNYSVYCKPARIYVSFGSAHSTDATFCASFTGGVVSQVQELNYIVVDKMVMAIYPHRH